MTFRWVKDAKVEANLRALGVSHEVEHVALADVDLPEGLRRQARMVGHLNTEYVLQLAVAMGQEAAAFPMTILQRPPRGKLWPWSGNHRLAAFALAFPEAVGIDCYVVKVSDPVMVDVLPRVVNSWESGLGFSKEERVYNAKWLVEHHSMRVEEAAKLLGIKPEWIVTTRRAEEVRAKLSGLGAKAAKLPKSVLIKMSPLQGNTNVLNQAARVIIDCGIRGKDADQLIDDVKSRSTELQQLAEVGRWEKMYADRNGARPKGRAVTEQAEKVRAPVVRENFIGKLTMLAKILERCDTIEKLQCTDPVSQDTVLRLWLKVNAAMTKVVQKTGGAR